MIQTKLAKLQDYKSYNSIYEFLWNYEKQENKSYNNLFYVALFVKIT